jgi:hypothetical protein
VSLEPLLVVVPTEVAQEAERRVAEAGELHRPTLRRFSDVRTRPYTAVTTTYGGVLASIRTFAVWAKRAVIPDVTLNAGPTQAPTTSSRSLLNLG